MLGAIKLSRYIENTQLIGLIRDLRYRIGPDQSLSYRRKSYLLAFIQ